MYLSKIFLQNFRSYDQKLLEFTSGVNLIYGPNGSGKTNILEAIYSLSCGKSFRSSSISKMINWNQNYSFVRGKITKNNEEIELETQFIKSEKTSSISRKFIINRVEKTRKDFLTNLFVVVFDPEDIRLITGSPTRRRDFVDSIFSNNWRYTSALSQYNKALKHRNELLDQIRSGTNSKHELFYWDQALIKNSHIIHQYRQQFFQHCNQYFSQHEYPEIQEFKISYFPSSVTEEKLTKNYQIDLNRGYTQIGIHRDDFIFESKIFKSIDKNLSSWGSRGQQRLAVLALRLAQIDYVEDQIKDTPVLILDDIFSELDMEHQQLVANLCQKYQTIFTSPDHDSLSVLSTANQISYL